MKKQSDLSYERPTFRFNCTLEKVKSIVANEDDKAAQSTANCLIDLPPQNEGETPIELNLVTIIWALVSNKANRRDNMVVVKDSVIENQIDLRIARSGADDSWEISWR